MTWQQQLITILVVILGTVATRFTPYLVFSETRPIPPVIKYLGKVLAPAVFGLLVVYCLRNVSVTGGSHGVPELVSLLVVTSLSPPIILNEYRLSLPAASPKTLSLPVALYAP